MEYYPNETGRICKATEYAIENGVAASGDNSCSWWLRTPNLESFDNTNMVVKSTDGSFDLSMYEISNAVRPAMWIKQD